MQNPWEPWTTRLSHLGMMGDGGSHSQGQHHCLRSTLGHQALDSHKECATLIPHMHSSQKGLCSYENLMPPLIWQEVAAAAAKSLQLCPTLCDPRDSSPPGSPIPGILQARTLEWVAISFSNAWSWKGKVKSLSRVRLFAIPWTAAYQAPSSMGFSRQEYWSGVPLPSQDRRWSQVVMWVMGSDCK